jgi:26S proteasome regulatory subunit N3
LRCTELFFAGIYLTLLYSAGKLEQGRILAVQLVQAIEALNHRALDILAARIYYLYGRFLESSPEHYEACLPTLLHSFRLANVRGDLNCVAELTNLILRYYVQFKLYDFADKFVTKITFPASAQNNQLARFMYYLGKISAVQLEYTEASKYLQHAIRKSPSGPGAAGFQQAAHKLFIVVQLLLGEIPEKALFNELYLKKALLPYFELTQAVRSGDLDRFQQVLTLNEAAFQRDDIWTLVLRLRHNVIRTGIRRIARAYSRISYSDICSKLCLESASDAEFVAAKALKDGVIEGKLDAEQQCLIMKPLEDIYATTEPEMAFSHRTRFCLSLYDEALKAMRYPEDLQTKRDWKSSRRHQLKEEDLGKPASQEEPGATSDMSFDEPEDDLDF